MQCLPWWVSQRQPCGTRGQGLLEYSLVFLMIVLAVIGALALIGPAVAQAISGFSPALESPRAPPRIGAVGIRGVGT